MKIETRFKKIGEDEPVFLIAEAGVNHNGNIDLAHKLIAAAADIGADAVKFQTFLVEESVSHGAPLASHHISNVKEDMSHYDLLKKLELPLNSFDGLKTHCEERGVVFISTPYDIPSAEYLISIHTEILKIASSEIINFPLLEVVGKSKVPIFLSTGMSDWDEIEEVINFVMRFGPQLCVLKCTSTYPASLDSINLRGIRKIKKSFNGCLVGLSDHTVGSEAALASLGFGTCVIEKHFTLDKKLWGPDHCASMTPDEFRQFVKSIRNGEKALGNEDWRVQDSEKAQRKTMQKGVYARHAIEKGETLDCSKVKFLRPKGILNPKEFLLHFQGRTVKKDVVPGEEIRYDLIEVQINGE